MARLYELSFTKADGEKVTGQLYTADMLTKAVKDREEWGCTNIRIKEYQEPKKAQKGE